jgi:hypothetical protein
MRKISFGLLLLILVSFSCSPKKEVNETNIPKGIIPPDSMTIVIAEMQVTEAILREYKRRGQQDEDRSVVFYNQTFEKLGITPERYKKSLAFYEEHQETYYEIYRDVISRLTEMQTELNSPKK